MNQTRRELLRDSVWMGAAAFLAGCGGGGRKLCGPCGAPVQGFVAPMLERVRVGVTGLGYRGGAAVRRLLAVPGVAVTALCEVREEYLAKSIADCAKKGARPPLTFSGEEGWKALCESDRVDVVYNCASWHLHAPVAAYAMERMHPYWKTAGAIAAKVGGHGGTDFLMDLRWVYCLRNGLPLDMDVYDLAAWCSICELSERSADNRAETIDVPDFTRGGWRTVAPLGLVDVDILEAGIGDGVGKVEGQFTI